MTSAEGIRREHNICPAQSKALLSRRAVAIRRFRSQHLKTVISLRSKAIENGRRRCEQIAGSFGIFPRGRRRSQQAHEGYFAADVVFSETKTPQVGLAFRGATGATSSYRQRYPAGLARRWPSA